MQWRQGEPEVSGFRFVDRRHMQHNWHSPHSARGPGHPGARCLHGLHESVSSLYARPIASGLRYIKCIRPRAFETASKFRELSAMPPLPDQPEDPLRLAGAWRTLGAVFSPSSSTASRFPPRCCSCCRRWSGFFDRAARSHIDLYAGQSPAAFLPGCQRRGSPAIAAL